MSNKGTGRGGRERARLELPLPPLRFPGRRQGVLEGAHCNSQTETGFSLDICLYKSLNSFFKARLGSNNGVVEVVPAVRPEVVLFMSKKLEWPAVVKERSAEKVTIEILNKDRTSKVVQPTQVKPFVMANVSSKRSELRRAYEEASKM